jgi:N-acyl homoserine lactone hydrolase
MMQIYALCCGSLEFDRYIFFPDHAPGTRMTIPVSSYLLIHPQGRVLFDTGVHCQAITDPIGRLGERRATRLTVRSQVGDDVVSQLARLGMRPEDITYVINSHFHVDHCGGNEFFPQATFLVQSREMARARDPDNPYDPQDVDHPLDYQLVDGDHDIFGDGTLVLLPTYGHTPGHQSLWVRDGQATPLVFTGDACDTQEHLDRDVLPQSVWNADAMSHSLTTLRNLRDTHGATLFYGHDPGQWQAIRHVPEPLL